MLHNVLSASLLDADAGSRGGWRDAPPAAGGAGGVAVPGARVGKRLAAVLPADDAFEAEEPIATFLGRVCCFAHWPQNSQLVVGKVELESYGELDAPVTYQNSALQCRSNKCRANRSHSKSRSRREAKRGPGVLGRDPRNINLTPWLFPWGVASRPRPSFPRRRSLITA